MNARRRISEWPEWWDWELELTPHVEKRMEDRGFSEVDLRGMLENAKGFKANVVEGRWTIETRHNHRDWAVVVEPDIDMQLLVVITAYPND